MTLPWPRPVPTVGDRTTAIERAGDPSGWAFPVESRKVLAEVIGARRDIRRFRPDPVPAAVLARLLAAAHAAPSVGHSQPWRFVVVEDPQTRIRAAVMADGARLKQASGMDPPAARHLLDLDLEGIREAPVGVVVCCDRRAPAAGVLGRATFRDADMWSCACAIQNLWLAARAEGLGVGWVTLFEPRDLANLVGAPEGVETLGWLCVGWPDERPPTPGLERRGWSRRASLDEVVLHERWPDSAAPRPPRSRLSPPTPVAVVGARDSGDSLLSPPGSMGMLDRVVDKVLAVGPASPAAAGALVIAAADHPVAARGVSAYRPEVTCHVVQAALAGESVGAVAARQSDLSLVVVDAGVEGGPVRGAVEIRPSDPRGDLVSADGLTRGDVDRLVSGGEALARRLGSSGTGLLAIGEIGVANTTVAAALAAGLLGGDASRLVGLGAGSDSGIVAVKRTVVDAAVGRARRRAGTSGGSALDPLYALAALGGGELAVLTGVLLGAARCGAVSVLDGMATCVAALAAVRLEPAVAAHLVAAQRSREEGHAEVLGALGLEPLLDLRLRAGEGAGAALAVGLVRAGLAVRAGAARTSPVGGGAVAQPGSAS